MSFESIKTKLKNLSKSSDKSFLEFFKELTFERFLARVSASEYRSNLIFKGGLCLKQYLDIGRETKDIDFLARELDGTLETIQNVFESVSKVDLEDHYKFHSVYVSILDLEHKQYPGFRVKIDVLFGNMKDRLQIDIGLGDIVDELELELKKIEYKNDPLIKNGDVSLFSYPPEFIFSEKLQAIIELKSINSRMKDYYDCFMLIKHDLLDDKKVKVAIKQTFEKRKTTLVPLEFFEKELGERWEVFSRKIKTQVDLEESVNSINMYLKKLSVI